MDIDPPDSSAYWPITLHSDIINGSGRACEIMLDFDLQAFLHETTPQRITSSLLHERSVEISQSDSINSAKTVTSFFSAN